jgi:hypothetical protein
MLWKTCRAITLSILLILGTSPSVWADGEAALIFSVVITTSTFPELALMETPHWFVEINRDNLAKDMARGGGEYIDAMAYLNGCPTEIHEQFARMTQTNFSQIFSEPNIQAETILSNKVTRIKNPIRLKNAA